VDLPHGHPTIMFLFNQTLVQKSTIVGAPCVEAKIIIWHIIKNLAPGFKHVLHGKILSINKSIFCIAMSFITLVILAVAMGES
jgi:hypothetical protein